MSGSHALFRCQSVQHVRNLYHRLPIRGKQPGVGGLVDKPLDGRRRAEKVHASALQQGVMPPRTVAIFNSTKAPTQGHSALAGSCKQNSQGKQKPRRNDKGEFHWVAHGERLCARACASKCVCGTT